MEDKFWNKVDIKDNFEQCWPWLGRTDPDGYGKHNIQLYGVTRSSGDPRQITVLAHRFAFWLRHGWWPEIARHQCNKPSCCNFAHLLDGTYQDNNRDTYRFGRRNDMRLPNGRFGAREWEQ